MNWQIQIRNNRPGLKKRCTALNAYPQRHLDNPWNYGVSTCASSSEWIFSEWVTECGGSDEFFCALSCAFWVSSCVFWVSWIPIHFSSSMSGITAPPERPSKPESNPKLTRLFVGLAKDSTKSKTWKKSKAKNPSDRFLADSAVYLTLQNKESNIDWCEKFSEQIINVIYFLSDAIKSRILSTNVWAKEKYITQKKRDLSAQTTTIKHKAWKITAHNTYRAECQKYIDKRKKWE